MQDMEKLYNDYFQTVCKYLFCMTHDADLSEELTQETFFTRSVLNVNKLFIYIKNMLLIIFLPLVFHQAIEVFEPLLNPRWHHPYD